jgi:transporter family-2 protein
MEIILLLSGLFLGLMQSFNGQLATYYHVFEVCFVVHVIGVLFLLLCKQLTTKEKLTFKGLPLYVYTVGLFGVGLVAISSFCTPRIGATLTMSLSVFGQLVMSAMVDHFGWFGKECKPFNLKRLPAYGIILVGLLMMVGW